MYGVVLFDFKERDVAQALGNLDLRTSVLEVSDGDGNHLRI